MPEQTPALVRPVRLSLSDAVHEALMEQLMSGEIRPDSVLRIDVIGRELGVSHSPVREALSRLEARGLVVRNALKGYRAAPLLTSDELSQLYAARLAVEPANAFAASGNVNAKFLRHLEDTVRRGRKARKGPTFDDYRGYLEAEEDFHNSIKQQADNRFLASAYDSIGGQLQRYRIFDDRGVPDAEPALAEHSEIIEAFRSGSADDACNAMQRHIRNSRRRAFPNESGQRTLDTSAQPG
ncbi:GntR family transcriptional regulator [Saxibacter everestensis]|uniref:GntR family transcriptional regulator n=1 Tax=Saxibacter everestensis TaxID=2909229 RepID=A0ABY8QXS8_9MICO|nr:GntR family transcriptional regulator [Brevibacteriaceae bacterium ZFBP1038]